MLTDHNIKLARNNGFYLEDYWVWGSSVVKGDNGLYHMFVSRWSKKLPFHPGWITDCEIAHAVSENACGPYRFSDVALGKRGAQYWDGQSCHNPKIVRYKNKYILYYMGSTHPFEPLPESKKGDNFGKHCVASRSNKRVGIAVADSPYGPWTRFDTPILPTKPNTFYSFLTSNPSPIIHSDGSVLLMFKARAHEGDTHGNMSIGLAKADNYLGPYKVISDEPVFGPNKLGEIEDPSIWLDDSGYHMLAKDMSGKICGEHHAGILCHSDNGIDWRLDDHPLAYSKNITWDNGEKTTLGQMERAFPVISHEDCWDCQILFAKYSEGCILKNRYII